MNVLKRASVIGDPSRLKQIFINLINNAIVYTPAGGVVSVELAEDKYNAYIKVSDTGIGISKEEIPRILNVSTGWIKQEVEILVVPALDCRS